MPAVEMHMYMYIDLLLDTRHPFGCNVLATLAKFKSFYLTACNKSSLSLPYSQKVFSMSFT